MKDVNAKLTFSVLGKNEFLHSYLPFFKRRNGIWKNSLLFKWRLLVLHLDPSCVISYDIRVILKKNIN